ncbi:DNA (Cytosine-5)-methyltransferase DRM1/2 isoform 2 [Hibiscus syriacus]|uniref:DNA (Cytosine-5)-methyltransferase DRM1/2 isoform 2 n=1 Tax=Hibiscus syriacus TaxID=106335 RepID=A0A6A3AF81_HIBSY|nr:DNA (Cytosine-5)-methyltransferase DRM1/2 isoform 2 [Hibiscus syriacus]
MPQHLLIQMLKVCSTLLLVEMSLKECPNIHIVADTVAYHLSVKAISEIYFSVGEKPIYANSDLMQWQEYIYNDIDSSSDIEEIMNSDSDEESKLLYLTKMGFSEAEASITMERCGSDSSIAELTDFICADQMAKVTDALLMVEDRKPLCNDPNYKQRRNLGYDLWKRKKQRKLEKKLLNEDDHAVYLSIPMIGSGVPTESDQITQRTLPEDAIGSPYFYYENMALAPVNVWTEISQYLFDVEPEFVDSKHFHATTLKRAIFIILPIENRFSLILLPPCADVFH